MAANKTPAGQRTVIGKMALPGPKPVHHVGLAHPKAQAVPAVHAGEAHKLPKPAPRPKGH